MPGDVSEAPASPPSGPIKGPQNFFAGLGLVAIALFTLWATSDLSQGTLRAMGPAMLPRVLAYCVGGCGIALAIVGLVKEGERLEAWGLRGPVLVLLGIIAFAVTIRPMQIGPITTPGLGLSVAGPLAILIGGHATPEVRLRDLAVLAFALTAACMVLFGDLLNLPIPIFPQWLGDIFPASFSNNQKLLTLAAVEAVLALVIFLAGRRRRDRQVDVVVDQPEKRI